MLALGLAAWQPPAPSRALRTDTGALLALPGSCAVVLVALALVGGSGGVARSAHLAAVLRLVARLVRGPLPHPALRSLFAGRRFDRGFEEATIGMAVVDADLTWVRVNAALCRIARRPPEELVGHSILETALPEDHGWLVDAAPRVLAGEEEINWRRGLVRPD